MLDSRILSQDTCHGLLLPPRRHNLWNTSKPLPDKGTEVLPFVDLNTEGRTNIKQQICRRMQKHPRFRSLKVRWLRETIDVVPWLIEEAPASLV